MRRWKYMFAMVVLLGIVPGVKAGGPAVITQTAVVRGLAPCDATPGFPCELDAAGSYRLGTNLVASGDTNIIVIRAGGVALDLGGYSLIGPGSGTGIGIVVDSEHVWIHDGFIRNTGGAGIDNHGWNRVRVDRVTVMDTGGKGVIVNNASRIMECRVFRSTGEGLSLYENSMVLRSIVRSVSGGTGTGIRTEKSPLIWESTVSDVSGDGIWVRQSPLIWGTAVQACDDDGVETADYGLLAHVAARDDGDNVGATGEGLKAGGGTLVFGCTASENAGTGISVGSESGVVVSVMEDNGADLANPTTASLGNNLCSGTSCP